MMVTVFDLTVFPGNPGPQYKRTRHNVAWMLLDHIGKSHNLIWREKFKGRIADFFSESSKSRFLQSQTFMNLTGQSVAAAARFFTIKAERILVVHDDVTLPFATIMWRLGGGMAGHKGLKSIGECLGTNNFYRLRIGIGEPKRVSLNSWVLGRFDPVEEAWLSDIFNEVEDQFRRLLATADMNSINPRTDLLFNS